MDDMVEANHLSAAELHAAMGTAEMPPLGGGDGGGVVRPPWPNTAGATVCVSPPGMSNMVLPMTTLAPHGSMVPPSSFTGGTVHPNIAQVSPPHFAPNTFPHQPVPAGGASLQQFAAMYPPQQLPPQFHHAYHQASAMRPSSQLSHEVQMQLQNRQQAASARFLSSNATNVFAQAETMHLMAVKRVHIDKMKKDMTGDSGMNSAVSSSATSFSGAGADGMAAMQKKNEERLEAAASMSSAATAESTK